MNKRKCTFSSKLKEKHTCFEGIEDSKDDTFCSVCKTGVPVENTEKSDLQQDIESKKHHAGNGTPDVLDCSVCLQPFVQPVQLPCFHIFCYLCVKGISQENERCAICRKAFPSYFLENPKLIAVQPPVTFDGSYQWFYEGVNGWWQYDDRTSVLIENAYQIGETQCEVMIAGFLYIIDFQQNFQVRRCDAHRRRRIKRDVITIPKKGIAGIRTNPEREPQPSTDASKAACPKTICITTI